MAAKFDFSNLSLDELTAVIEEVTALRNGKIDARRKELQAELAALDGLGKQSPIKAVAEKVGRGSKPKMYRHPTSGREYANVSEVPREFKEMGIKTKEEMAPYRITQDA